MTYAVEMGSGVMIYMPSFIKTGSDIRNLIGEDPQAHRQHGNRSRGNDINHDRKQRNHSS
jgi:hypothetical protein